MGVLEDSLQIHQTSPINTKIEEHNTFVKGQFKRMNDSCLSNSKNCPLVFGD